MREGSVVLRTASCKAGGVDSILQAAEDTWVIRRDHIKSDRLGQEMTVASHPVVVEAS